MYAETRAELWPPVTAAISDLLGFEYNTVRLYDQSTEQLVPRAVSAALADDMGPREPYGRGESVQWDAIDSGEILVYQQIDHIDDEVERAGTGSMMVVPIDSYGVISMGSPAPRAITEDDVELGRVFGANVAAAIDRVDQQSLLKQREERLQERNERLDRFSGLVAHELRNPLGIASGHLDFVVGTEQDTVHLEASRRAVRRMERLTESLIDLVRDTPVTEQTTQLSVATIATEVFDSLRAFRAGLIIETPVTIEAEKTRLTTLLEQVLDNAVRYSGPTATVWIGELSAGGFYIADDGPGFMSESADEIFSYRPSAGRNRMRLGLAIVQEIAHAHNWNISVTTSRAGGTRLEFHTNN